MQFYNNGGCNHGGGSFTSSVQQWSKNIGPTAQLYIGALADAGQGSGFLAADALAQEVKTIQGLGLSNFGGYALWDASEAKASGMGTTLKAALGA